VVVVVVVVVVAVVVVVVGNKPVKDPVFSTRNSCCLLTVAAY